LSLSHDDLPATNGATLSLQTVHADLIPDYWPMLHSDRCALRNICRPLDASIKRTQ
jgi:hypothetical protein